MAKNINRSKSNLAKNAIPNLVGLSRTTAQNLLTSLGFRYTENTQSTSNQANDSERVQEQAIAADSVQPLDTNVEYTRYQFGFTPFGAFGFTPFGAFGFTPFGFTPFGFTPFGFTPGGCFKYGTKIQMSDGSWKNMEDLVIGDEVISLNIPGLGLAESTIDLAQWESTDMTGVSFSTTIIANIKLAESYAYYKINNTIDVTWEHHILVLRDGVYKFLQVENVIVGDWILDETLTWQLVETKEEVFETINTVTIDTEELDVYFVKGMLAHNLLPSK